MAGYMRDSLGERLDNFVARRDLPRVVANFDASMLTTADHPDGSNLDCWPDISGSGHDVFPIGNTPPTMTTIGGQRAVHFGTSQGLLRRDFGQGLGEPAGYSQPNTFIAVVRLSSLITTQRAIVGATTAANQQSLLVGGGTPSDQNPYIFAGGTGVWGGRSINDDTWHVVTGVFDVASAAIYVDGFLWVAASANVGTAAMVQLCIGCTADTAQAIANPVNNADYREVIVCNQRLSPKQVLAATKALAAKWGITTTLPKDQAAVTYVAATDSTAQNIRYWLPKTIKPTGNKLLLWSHPHAQNELVSPGYFAYPLFHTAVNEGWIVAATRQHGDSWGNSNATTDLTNLHTYINSRWGVSDVVLVGGSMGGLATANSVALGAVPNVRGAATVDGVLDLASIYANATYTASIKTAYGIAADGSDYATKTSGRDPMLRSASDFTGIRWRFYAADGDTTVPPTSHADPFATKIAAAPEKAVMRHTGAHLANASAWSADFAAFLNRCAA